jgi:hypothetical protein
MNAKDQPVTPSTTHSLCQIDKSLFRSRRRISVSAGPLAPTSITKREDRSRRSLRQSIHLRLGALKIARKTDDA